MEMPHIRQQTKFAIKSNDGANISHRSIGVGFLLIWFAMKYQSFIKSIGFNSINGNATK